MRAVTLDQFRVVEVIAGVEPNIRGRAARSSCSWSAERSETFTPSTFALCSRIKSRNVRVAVGMSVEPQ